MKNYILYDILYKIWMSARLVFVDKLQLDNKKTTQSTIVWSGATERGLSVCQCALFCPQ